ncbi:MAG: Hpt domain-containing protein [Gammaproteobacteria bacterium]|nr:Hpt domain-containing protein [Gammaproteobacteria bacterium]
MSDDIDYTTLKWVKKELDETLKQTRQALEAYVENPGDTTQMRFCSTYLHQVHGTLQMMELYGAALLAEEMELLTQALLDGTVAHKDDAYEILMRGILQLPDYLERLQAGGKDIPMALLPLLNDLRAARGQKLLSENALFAPDLTVPAPHPPGWSSRPAGQDVTQLARGLRHMYQKGLLSWFRGDDVAGGLERLARVVEELEQASTLEPVSRLWWVCAGVIEALQQGALVSGVSVKLLLGQVDRLIKQLIDKGEQGLADHLSPELVKNLLYYVAQAEPRGERVIALKQAFHLDQLLPREEEIEQARDSLSGPNVELMQTVSAAVKEDLNRVKDALDIFVRGDRKRADDLQPLADMLRQVADTLGMLGLGVPRKVVQEQAALMKQIAAGELKPDEAGLMEMASALLYVESSLDGLIESRTAQEDQGDAVLKGLKRLQSGTASEPVPQDESRLPQTEYRHVLGAVIHEAIIDMAKGKDAIVAFMESPWQHDMLVDVPQLFKQISGSLLMLSLNRAAALLESVNGYLSHELLEQRSVPAPEQLDRLADAIASIEYYLEAASEGRSNREAILDVAAKSVAELGYPVTEEFEPAPVSPAEPQTTPEQAAPAPESGIEEIDLSSLTGGGEVAEEIEISAPSESEPPASLEPEPVAPPHEQEAVPPSSSAAAPPAGLDEEILQIFIEEASEECATLSEQLPKWKANLDDRDALTTIRRSFHTLKGSGRLVGAVEIGEFAWAYENMLNRVIDHTVAATPAMFDLLDQALAALPQLIEQLKGGPEPNADVQRLAARAHDFSQPGKAQQQEDEEPAAQEPAVTQSPAPPAGAVPEPEPPAAEEPAAEQAPAMDPVLYEIFRKESTGHLEAISGFLVQAGAQGGQCRITEPLVRAVHTLHGSARMAGASGIAELSGLLEKYIKALTARNAPAPAAVLEVLEAGVAAINEMLAALRSPETGVPDASALMQRLSSLYMEELAAQDLAVERQVTPPPSDEEPRPESAAGEQDSELLEIFMEEGTEILDASEIALQRWGREPDNTGLVVELQRELHTLKGGARLAGLTEMGDLSHAMESLLTAIVDGRVEVSQPIFDVMQRVLDALLGMLQRARDHAPMEPAVELIREVEDARAGRVTPLAAVPEEGAQALAAPESAADAIPAPEAAPALPIEEPPAAVIPTVGEVAPELLPALEEELPSAPFPEERRAAPRIQYEMVRVRADLLDNLVNAAGEVSIYRSRVEQQIGAFHFNLTELEQTVARLRDQLRNLEIETEAQILFRYEAETPQHQEDFDPLELDRYSQIQQLSRALMESVSDLTSLQGLLENLTRESETLLLQQSRVNTQLQEGLMRTRMVPFSSLIPRMRRVVRQTCQELGKQATLQLQGAEGEMDRTVLNRMVAPIEHMLRNAVSHGIEKPALRRAAGKSSEGTIRLSLAREAADVVLKVSDDGAGMDLEVIRRKAIERGLLSEGAQVSDDEVMQFILESGFSTAQEITQISGRGVGMDVVSSEIKQLGGSLHIQSRHHEGTSFTVRLPFTLAVNHALLVHVGEDVYAIPLSSIEGVMRVDGDELARFYRGDAQHYEYAGQHYQVRYLGALLGAMTQPYIEPGRKLPVLLVHTGDRRAALQVDALMGSREIVVKSLGPQISAVRSISGATILGDGRVVLILDVAALVRLGAAAALTPRLEEAPPAEAPVAVGPTVMVVDDSITVRKVTVRLLERHNMRVLTAKDGVDAVALLQDHVPDVMLLDIEMPRMDGYELATHMRNDARLRHIPIIMITSRTGGKHRQRAAEIGVDDYLGKPYQEGELLEHIHAILRGRHGNT